MINSQITIKSLFLNKKVLVTGHTGFKGSWISAWLQQLGARVTGLSLEPPSTPSHFGVAAMNEFLSDLRVDIRDSEALQSVVLETQPDFVFHLAAQSLVLPSYKDPLLTYQTNLLGTLNLLEALRKLKKSCVTLLITSDKCYKNVEWVWGYRETDQLGGTDPYSASKGAVELAIHSHIKSFFPDDGMVSIGVARAGNVIGGGDWASERLVPDCVRSWVAGNVAILRNPKATRPWQHVLEPLSGYLTLAAALKKNPKLNHGEPFNFGPPAHQKHSVEEMVEEMSKHWPEVAWENASDSRNDHYESGLLKLNCDKALHHLNWQAVLSFEETIRMTAEWYLSYYKNPKAIREVTLSHIREYESYAHEKKMPWIE
jgi:CDP-glucose 4,6-dehydratase